MKFQVHVGDRWDDGHGKFDTFIFETDSTIEQVNAANKDLNENLEFERWFEAYEKSTISSSQYAELIAFLPEAEKFFEEETNWKTNQKTGDFYLDDGSDGYIRLWVSLIEKSDPTIKLVIVNDDGIPTIELGGYGLYH